MNVHEVIRKPLVTEKSNISREEENIVTLAVDPRANKHEIAHAVESLFQVTVLEVIGRRGDAGAGAELDQVPATSGDLTHPRAQQRSDVLAEACSLCLLLGILLHGVILLSPSRRNV